MPAFMKYPNSSDANKMRKESMRKNKNKKNPYADPNHPMNRERTGPSVLKEDPLYKKSGGKIYNCR